MTGTAPVGTCARRAPQIGPHYLSVWILNFIRGQAFEIIPIERRGVNEKPPEGLRNSVTRPGPSGFADSSLRRTQGGSEVVQLDAEGASNKALPDTGGSASRPSTDRPQAERDHPRRAQEEPPRSNDIGDVVPLLLTRSLAEATF